MFNLFSKKTFGLDISDCSIEAVLLTGSFENLRLLALGRRTLEQGIVENGEILDKERLANKIRDLVKKPEFGRINTEKIIFSLPESKIFIHIFEIRSDSPKEEIKSQIEQTFPYQLAELYFDYKMIKGADSKKILLAVSPKKTVDDYLELFKACGLKPLALGIKSESLARSLIDKEEEPVLLADIGAKTTNFSVFDKRELSLNVSVPVAGNQFTQSLAEKLNISFEKAENLKRKIGFNPRVKEGRVFLILQREIQGIILEIGKIDNYFKNKTGKEIEKIILAGGSAVLPGLSEYLGENLGKEVVVGDPWVKINIDILRQREYFKKALELNPVMYATTLGSGLWGLIKNQKESGLNLLPKGRE